MSELPPFSTAVKPGVVPVSGLVAYSRACIRAQAGGTRDRVDSMETDAVRTARPVEGDDIRRDVWLPVSAGDLADTGESACSEFAGFREGPAATDVSAAQGAELFRSTEEMMGFVARIFKMKGAMRPGNRA